jgi:metal-responsive CopG/Arc/MetJ family transcriptional regulator
MKVKTSLTLSEDLLERIDRMAGPEVSRSSFIEAILRDYIEARARAKREARDVALINRHAARLNEEMRDILSFQAELTDE